MRFNGHNVLAIVVAALIIYAIEFVIFAILIPGDQYMAMTGMTADQADASRMPFGIAPPLLAAIGLSLTVNWGPQFESGCRHQPLSMDYRP